MKNTTFSNASSSTIERQTVERLSTQQIAAELGRTNQTIRNWMKTGLDGVILRSFKHGSRRFVFRSDLNEFLEQTTTEGFPNHDHPHDHRSPAQFRKDQEQAEKEWARLTKPLKAK